MSPLRSASLWGDGEFIRGCPKLFNPEPWSWKRNHATNERCTSMYTARCCGQFCFQGFHLRAHTFCRGASSYKLRVRHKWADVVATPRVRDQTFFGIWQRGLLVRCVCASPNVRANELYFSRRWAFTTFRLKCAGAFSSGMRLARTWWLPNSALSVTASRRGSNTNSPLHFAQENATLA